MNQCVEPDLRIHSDCTVSQMIFMCCQTNAMSTQLGLLLLAMMHLRSTQDYMYTLVHMRTNIQMNIRFIRLTPEVCIVDRSMY